MNSILGHQGTIRSHDGKALLVLLVGVLSNGAFSTQTLAAVTTPSLAKPASIAGLPLNFERNLGQAPGEVQFLAHGPRYSIELTEQGAVLAFGGETSAAVKAIRLRVQGAAHTLRATAEEPMAGRVNYYIGNDPSKWRTNIATYNKVRYSNVYPGIDLVYYGTEGKLEYDFAISPGSDARKITLNFQGARRLRVDSHGDLKIETPEREIAFQSPVAYQINDAGRRSPVSARYRVNGTAVRFEVADYDHSKPLIIDPVLSYFSYLGGSGFDVAGIAPPSGSSSYFSGQAAAIDAAGDLYVTGHTNSTNFPTQSAFAPAPPKANPNGGQSWAFVTKFAPDAKTLIFSTYLGGTGGNDRAASIAVDSSGNAVVVGVAESNDFPATSGAYQTVCNPQFSAPNVEVPACNTAIGQGSGAFVSKFSPSGALLHSTFLSGTGTNTSAYAVAVDASGRVYVAGETLPGAVVPAGAPSSQQIPFPTTAGAALVTPPYSTGAGGYQNVLSAQFDAFISVFDPTLSTLLYSSLFGEPQVSNAGVGFGGASFTFGEAVTVDAAGNFYLAGTTEDGSLPTTAGAYEASASSCGTVTNNVLLNCPFVAKFSPVGSGTPSLIYGTYLGHTVTPAFGDLMTGIAADAAGDAYVTGFTNQATFPTTSGAYQTTCNQYGVNGNTSTQCASAFIAKLNPSGTALLASTYFGGSVLNNVVDAISSMGPIALDAAGNVYIAGAASGGLAQVNSLGSSNGAGSVVSPFVAQFNSSLTTLKFATLFGTGGQSQLVADGLALDTAGNIYVAGSVNSPPSSAATSGVFQSAYGGGSSDVFVAKIVIQTPTTITLSAAPSSPTVGTAVNLTATVAEVGGSSVPTGTVTFKDGTTSLGSMTLNGTGIAVYSTSSLSVGAHSITAAYGGDAANGGSASSAASVTVSAAAPTVTISVAPTSITVGQSATLTWSSTNATACTASNAWTGSEALSGTMSETPTAAGTLSYVLTCTGAGGSANATATLTVTAAPPLPTVTIAVSPTSITVGQSATLTWSSGNATSCTASGTWSGAEATSGTLSVSPSATGTASYTLACTGAGGTANGTATLTVAAAPSGSGGKSGGGGGMGLWEVVALSLLGVVAQRRRAVALRS
jgi:Bacterial Ig-like domain (group 3)/Beta-propeller repeat